MIRTFIQVTSLVLTLEAAFFLAKGNLGLSVETIHELSKGKWDLHSQLASTLAQQRADTWVGFVFLFLAFVLQMCNAFWPMGFSDFGVHKGAAVYALILCVVVGFGAFFLTQKVADHTVCKVRKLHEQRATARSESAEM